ncbi:anion permease [Rhodoferax sp.]|uniref:inorganic phosphate transporter n=1 Tax=Rhodoferax sp. TaxID=50421 RepID=UPI0027798D52|nr:inorganic phosphate transporter [Rhodoferax sp.]
MEWLLVGAALFVAFSNGANDNFKGFATVWGSNTLNYRQALTLATLATVAGSLVSLWLADSLVQQFSGRGLVSSATASAPDFILSVALGAATTVWLATRLGFPISTTHALIGGLIGAGLGQQGGVVHFDRLASSFLLPLLLSPLLAAVLGVAAYRLFRLRPVERDCACIVAPESAIVVMPSGTLVGRMQTPRFVLASAADCEGVTTPVRLSVPRSLDHLHVLSAMSICFARAVNDTPKLAALLLAARMLNAQASVALIAAAMAVGGLLFAKRVAQTMSQRVVRMDHGQGLAANLITAALVLLASKFGLPVSTTHVALGSIAGVGASANTLNWSTLRNVLLSWLATLPLAAFTAWLVAQWL